MASSCNQFAQTGSEFTELQLDKPVSAPANKSPYSNDNVVETEAPVSEPTPAPALVVINPAPEPTPVPTPVVTNRAPAPTPAPSPVATNPKRPSSLEQDSKRCESPSVENPIVYPEPIILPPRTIIVPRAYNDMTNENPTKPLPQVGLIGRIYDGSKLENVTSFSQLVSEGTLLDEKIYLPNLNFSRATNSGFPKPEGGIVLNSLGKPLLNKFGLLIETNLSLLPDDEEGYYQLAVIHDGGMVVEAKVARKDKKSIISADHLSPTKFSCSLSTLIKMEKGKTVPLVLKYFQGDTNQLALIFMWRKVRDSDGSLVKEASTKDLNEIRCGQAGNHFFFDTTSNINPTMDYKDLFNPHKRVIPWKLVNSGNNRLHTSVDNKNCVK